MQNSECSPLRAKSPIRPLSFVQAQHFEVTGDSETIRELPTMWFLRQINRTSFDRRVQIASEALTGPESLSRKAPIGIRASQFTFGSLFMSYETRLRPRADNTENALISSTS